MASFTKIKKVKKANRKAKMGRARKKAMQKPGTNKLLPMHNEK